MKILLNLFIVSFALMATSFTCADSSNKNIVASNTAGNGFAVIELFTSEGCSSCPPADDAVAKLLKEYNNNVYVLGYHVDYWDNLGWKDAFSSAAYSNRQRSYARVFNLSSIYTPQVVINGEEQFVGSDNTKLHNTINKDLKQTENNVLNVSAKAANKLVTVSYNIKNTGENLNIALVQLAVQSQVKRGENSGATLHHVNVVRSLQTISLKSSSGNITLSLPNGVSAKDCNVIAFTQNAGNLKITSAAKVDIQP